MLQARRLADLQLDTAAALANNHSISTGEASRMAGHNGSLQLQPSMPAQHASSRCARMGTAQMIVHMHLLGRMYCLPSLMNPASGATDVAFHLSGGLGAAVSVNAMRGLVAMRGNLPQAMFVQGYQVRIVACECRKAGCMLCWSLAPQLCKAGRSTQLRASWHSSFMLLHICRTSDAPLQRLTSRAGRTVPCRMCTGVM